MTMATVILWLIVSIYAASISIIRDGDHTLLVDVGDDLMRMDDRQCNV